MKFGVAGWIGSDRVSQFFLTEWVPPRFVSEISARAQPPARVPKLICSPGRARTWLQDKHMPGGSGGRSPQPPEAAVVNICDLRAYGFCVSWLRPPEDTEGGLYSIP